MRRHALLLLAGLSMALSTASALALAEEEPESAPERRPLHRTFTVEEAVQLSLAQNPLLLSREATAQGARHLESSSLGRMLPVVHFFDEGQHWDSAFSIPFGTTNFNVRNQNVNSLAVSADQPLTGLFHLSHEKSSQRLEAEASEADIRAARAELKEAVETGFLSLFEAKALEDIAKASEAELADQVQVTKARVAAGVLTTADALRVQVAVANAKQQEILAHTQGEVARARLLSAMGLLPTEDGVDFVEPKTLLAHASAPLPRMKDAQQQAFAIRPELKRLSLRLESADHVRQARKLALLPDIDAEAAYNRLDGEILAPTNAAFVGFKVNWNVWEWGTSWYAQKAAEEQMNTARHDLEVQAGLIAVDVATGLAQARSATNAVDVARDTIASAEEAFRVTEALLKAGSATTTDLLDAQAALTQARLNLTRAEYEQAMAQVTLARRIGK
jgi:outer membrane protein